MPITFPSFGADAIEETGVCETNLILSADDYVLFDCPGQVELFTHHSSLRKIFFQIEKLGYRVCSHHTLSLYL